MNFYITKHCRERYIQRVLGSSNSHNNILLTILKDLQKSNNITSKISTETPRFTLFIKEKYGNCNILQKEHILFICKKRKGTYDLYDVVTCYIDKDNLKMFKDTVLSNDEIHMKLKLLKMKTKQVIVMLKFPNLRTGKYCAQASHASLASFLNCYAMAEGNSEADRYINQWLYDSFTKVVLYVETPEELVELYTKIQEKIILVH